MNNKKIIMLSALTATLCITVISVSTLQNQFEPASASTEYKIDFSSTKNKLTNDDDKTGSSVVKTNLGSEYFINYTDVSGSSSSIWQSFDENSSFSTSFDKEMIHNNAFFGMKEAKITFSEEDKNYNIYFSKDGSFSSAYSRKYVSKKGENIIEFEGHPHYFKFEAIDPLNIVELSLTYSCDSLVDYSWNVSHGVIPTIKDDSIIYGLYPKTIVSPVLEKELISNLLEKSLLLGVCDEELFFFEDEYYVKDTCNPFRNEYYFSDGTSAVSGETYFFKCEPITWNICSSEENIYIVDSSYIVYGHNFNSTTKNKYVNSELRTWLNNDYFNKAFFLSSKEIKDTNFSEIGELEDKVWIGSKDEYNGGWERYQNQRSKQYSDFALCNYLFKSTEWPYEAYSRFWTRTSSRASSLEMVVDYNDNILSDVVTDPSCGVSPAITLKVE